MAEFKDVLINVDIEISEAEKKIALLTEKLNNLRNQAINLSVMVDDVKAVNQVNTLITNLNDTVIKPTIELNTKSIDEVKTVVDSIEPVIPVDVVVNTESITTLENDIDKQKPSINIGVTVNDKPVNDVKAKIESIDPVITPEIDDSKINEGIKPITDTLKTISIGNIIDINVDATKAIEMISMLRDAQKKLKDDQKNLKGVELEENKVKYAALSKEINAWNNIAVKATQAQNTLNGTMNQAKQALSVVTAEFNRQKLILGEDSEEVKKLATQAKALSDALKEQEGAIGNNTRNVGNYMQSAKELGKELKTLVLSITAMKESGNTSSKEFAEMEKQAAKLKNQINDLKDETERYSKEVKNIEGVVSVFAGFQTVITGVSDGMKLFGIENKDLEKSMQKLTQVMAVLNGIQAVSTLLSKESIAVRFISNIQVNAATLATNLQTAAEGKNIVVRYAAIVAQKILNAVMAANPIGLLILGLTALAGAFYVLTGRTQENIEVQKASNEAMKTTFDNTKALSELKKGFAEKEFKDQELVIEKLKSNNATATQINNAEIELIKKKQEANRVAQADFEHDINTQGLLKVKAMAQTREVQVLEEKLKYAAWFRATAEAEAIKTEIDLKKSVIAVDVAKLNNARSITAESIELQKQLIAAQKKGTDITLEETVSEAEARYKLIQLKQKEVEESLLLDNEYLNERKKIVDKNAAIERNLATIKEMTATDLEVELLAIEKKAEKDKEDLDKRQLDQVVKLTEATFEAYKLSHQTLLDETKAFNEEMLNAEKNRLKAERDEAVKVLDEKYQINTDKFKNDLVAQQNYANEVTAINQKLAKDQLIITEKYNADQLAADKQLKDLRLAVAKDGSSEQLALKIQGNKDQLDADLKHAEDTIKNEEKLKEAKKLLTEKSNQEIAQMNADHRDKIIAGAGEFVSKLQEMDAADTELKIRNIENSAQEEKNKLNEGFEEKVILNQQAANQEIIDLKNKYKQGVIDKESYDSEIKTLQDKANKSQKTTKEQHDKTLKGIEEKAVKDSKKIGAESAESSKALAVASVIINTLEASIKTYASLAAFPPVAAVASAAVVATGALTIAKILATPIPDSGGGGTEGAGGLSAPPSGGGSTSTSKFAPTVNEGIASRASDVSSLDAKIPLPAQPVLIIDDVTARQNRDKITNDIATI